MKTSEGNTVSEWNEGEELAKDRSYQSWQTVVPKALPDPIQDHQIKAGNSNTSAADVPPNKETSDA